MAVLYAVRNGNWFGDTSDLYTVNPSTGATTSIGPTGYAIDGIAFHPGTGVLYGFTSINDPVSWRTLCTINISTGAATLIGGINGMSNWISDIAFDSAGNLYGIGGQFFRHIFSINLTTGACTDIGHADTFGALDYTPGFEIDAAGYGWVMDTGWDDSTPSYIYRWGLSPVARQRLITLSGTLPVTFAELGAASFDNSGVMWLTADPQDGTNAYLVKVDPDGTLHSVGDMGVDSFSALAWDTFTKPNPWAAPPIITYDFDDPSHVVTDKWTVNGFVFISTDGYASSPTSLKIDAENNDSYIDYNFTDYVRPLTTEWSYYGFALYVLDWNTLWAGGFQWTPAVLGFYSGPGDIYLVPTSPTTGNLEFNFGSGSFGDSTAVPAGQWVSVVIGYVANDGAGARAVRFWIDGVDSGIISGSTNTTAPDSISLGDTSWGGAGVDLTYYLDSFVYELDTPPALGTGAGTVDISGASFGGEGSGTDYDGETGSGATPHPVNDSYSILVGHPLVVAAPGVLGNDFMPTTATLNTGPSHGTLSFNSDGSFTYTSDPTYTGTDTFTYDGDGGTATVTITVESADTIYFIHPIFHDSPALRVGR